MSNLLTGFVTLAGADNCSKCTPLMVIGMPKGGIFFFFAAINIISL